MEKEKDAEFLEFVVKSLVDHPESVKINRVVDEMGVLLNLDVHSDDMGKIIGRSGNTAKAIRILLRVVGMKNNARVNLKINEPEGGRKPSQLSSNSKSVDNVDDVIEDLKV
ncbi:MAG: KH domain-containing protein [Candidatus Zambryskibacteria bacterium]|nr:KH domain-containing protein [Candidatus Zambryskibacteria bacterium]